MTSSQYTHGHHDSVLRSHRWRTAENSAGYLLPYLTSGMSLLDIGCGPGTITVDLARLPEEAYALVFTVNSFRGQKFTEVRNAYCRLLDVESGAELVRFDLTDSEPHTGVIMSVLIRQGGAWDMTAVGEFHEGKSASAMYKPAEATVRALTSR